jgi:hypothetical protein
METVGNSEKTAGNNAETVGAGIEETKKHPPKGGCSVSVPPVDKGARRLRARDPLMTGGSRVAAQTGAAKKIRADDSVLPAIDCPVLIGAAAIAAWLGIRPGRCRGMIEDGSLPTFRLPGRAVRCALKSSIITAFEEHERRSTETVT